MPTTSLAPYGEPVFRDLILDHLMNVKEDGSFWLDQSYFNYATGLTMTSAKFDKLFGGPARKPDELLAQRHMDLAASVQAVTEEVMVVGKQQLGREVGGFGAIGPGRISERRQQLQQLGFWNSLSSMTLYSPEFTLKPV